MISLNSIRLYVCFERQSYEFIFEPRLALFTIFFARCGGIAVRVPWAFCPWGALPLIIHAAGTESGEASLYLLINPVRTWIAFPSVEGPTPRFATLCSFVGYLIRLSVFG